MNKEQEEKLHKAIEKLLGPKTFLLGCHICGWEETRDSYEELHFKDIQETCKKCDNPTVFLRGRIMKKQDE
jgi:hypothetical protein